MRVVVSKRSHLDMWSTTLFEECLCPLRSFFCVPGFLHLKSLLWRILDKFVFYYVTALYEARSMLMVF